MQACKTSATYEMVKCAADKLKEYTYHMHIFHIRIVIVIILIM